MPSTSNEALDTTSADVDTTTDEPSDEYIETSVDGDETSEQDEQLEDKKSSVDDYVDNSSSDTDTLAKRYSDSSREAKRLNEENKALKAKLEALESNSYGENQQNTSNQSSKNSDERLERVEKELEARKLAENEAIILNFEEENGITPDLRSKMKPIVTPLIRDGKSMQEALDIAYSYISKDPEMLAKVKDKAKYEVLAETLTRSSASYSEAGKSSTGRSSNNDLPSLTRQEYEYARKLGAVDEQGRVRKSFLVSLKSVRNS